MTHSESLQPPTQTEVVERLKAVLLGTSSREEVSAWADQWVMAEHCAVPDGRLWELLILASGVNLIDPVAYPERKYLYSKEEIWTWLREIAGIHPPGLSPGQ